MIQKLVRLIKVLYPNTAYFSSLHPYLFTWKKILPFVRFPWLISEARVIHDGTVGWEYVICDSMPFMLQWFNGLRKKEKKIML